jgi:hypothetical protein
VSRRVAQSRGRSRARVALLRSSTRQETHGRDVLASIQPGSMCVSSTQTGSGLLELAAGAGAGAEAAGAIIVMIVVFVVSKVLQTLFCETHSCERKNASRPFLAMDK